MTAPLLQDTGFREATIWATPIRDLGLAIVGTQLEPIVMEFRRELEAVGGIDVENHRRHAAQPRELARAKSPLAHDELVAAPGLPNDDGL